MIVSELIDLLRTQDPEKAVGIQWHDDAEIVTWVEDLLLMARAAELTKHIGFGNRHGIIFLSTVEDGEYSIAVGGLLESLSDCKATATVAITSSEENEEKTVGYVVGTVDWNEDVFVLTAQKEEFIQRR